MTHQLRPHGCLSRQAIMFAVTIGIGATILPFATRELFGSALGLGFILVSALVAPHLATVCQSWFKMTDDICQTVAVGVGDVVNAAFWAIVAIVISRIASTLSRRALGFGFFGGSTIAVSGYFAGSDFICLPAALATWMMFGMNGSGIGFVDDNVAPAFGLFFSILFWGFPIALLVAPIVGVPRRNENEKE